METEVDVVQIGTQHWPRWMIASADGQFFGNGGWNARRRDGEVWNHHYEAAVFLEIARIKWQELES